MKYDDEALNRFKNENRDNITRAAEKARQALGKDADKFEELLGDKERLRDLMQFVSKEDLDKIAGVLNDPEQIDRILSSKKAMDNIKKILGDR